MSGTVDPSPNQQRDSETPLLSLTIEQNKKRGPDFPADPTAYSVAFRNNFCNGRIKGEYLFQDFWEYFIDWTIEEFRLIETTERALLRDDLRFQPRPGYTGCIICRGMDCHSSRHSDEEQAVSKARYFAARKAEGMKATDNSFKSYLAYTEGSVPDSDQIRTTSGHYSDIEADSDTSLEINIS
ncbi:hypothetical protein IFR05_017213 [Cadophora sp. M221]|nr:hypothetical protein IFR05_017213 [Cadophora sp. M221]